MLSKCKEGVGCHTSSCIFCIPVCAYSPHTPSCIPRLLAHTP
nr:MAG TPA: hypothetical protein [Caudoviricetes sp.]